MTFIEHLLILLIYFIPVAAYFAGAAALADYLEKRDARRRNLLGP